MDENGSLGLFLSGEKAVAVWISSGSEASVLHTMNITSTEDEPSTIALQAARAVNRAGFTFDEAFVAIDCGYYTQYKLHSEFDDYSQVDSTIKFDAEEAAATDAMNLAVAFDITGKNQMGSEVTVYTADRQLLTDILLDVQEGALDPGLIEPDGVCLARALSQDQRMAERTDTIFVILSSSNCYMIRLQADFAPVVRTFLIGKGQNVTNVLSREITLARGSADSDHPINSITLMGCIDNVDKDLLAQRSGLEILTEEPQEDIASALATEDDLACHELMIAYGAALAAKIRGHKTDFRRDFMPYQGRRKVLEGSLRLIGISVTVLLITIALFFQMKTFRMNRDTDRLVDKLNSESQLVLMGRKIRPPRTASSYLKSELDGAKRMEAGLGPGDDKSVPAKLTFFLDAMNKTPKNIDINIQQIKISERAMNVRGDTKATTARKGVTTFFNQIKKHPKIKMNGESIRTSGNRDTFQFNVEPKQTKGKRR
ncbi:MAG: hypothetical protein ACYTEU_07325 [Planctomycetota bacterium]